MHSPLLCIRNSVCRYAPMVFTHNTHKALAGFRNACGIRIRTNEWTRALTLAKISGFSLHLAIPGRKRAGLGLHSAVPGRKRAGLGLHSAVPGRKRARLGLHSAVPGRKRARLGLHSAVPGRKRAGLGSALE